MGGRVWCCNGVGGRVWGGRVRCCEGEDGRVRVRRVMLASYTSASAVWKVISACNIHWYFFCAKVHVLPISLYARSTFFFRAILKSTSL